MGMELAKLLNAEIEKQVTEEKGRSDVIAMMAESAGIEPATVTQILNEEIAHPPLERLEGFAEALGVSLDSLIEAAEQDGATYERKRSIGSILRTAWGKLGIGAKPVTRDVEFHTIADAAWSHLNSISTEGIWYSIQGIYARDDQSLFLIASANGGLFRSDIAISGSTITFGEFNPVSFEFKADNENVETRTEVRRSADGRMFWMSIAATNVLNRSGEIDPSALFEDMSNRWHKLVEGLGLPYPLKPSDVDGMTAEQREAMWPYDEKMKRTLRTRNVCHHPDLITGRVYHIEHIDNTLISMGEFDDTVLGRMEYTAAANNPDGKGESIEYLQRAEAQLVRVQADGVDVAFQAIEKGEFIGTAGLIEERAAALMTTVLTRSNTMGMTKTQEDTLRQWGKDAGIDDVAEEVILQTNSVNETIDRGAEDGTLIKREDEGADTADEPDTPPTEDTEVDPIADDGEQADDEQQEEDEGDAPEDGLELVIDESIISPVTEAVTANLVGDEALAEAVAQRVAQIVLPELKTFVTAQVTEREAAIRQDVGVLRRKLNTQSTKTEAMSAAQKREQARRAEELPPRQTLRVSVQKRQEQPDIHDKPEKQLTMAEKRAIQRQAEQSNQ